MNKFFGYDVVDFNADETGVVILDQRLLPGEEVFLTLYTVEEVFDAIALLKVRGAPAIGVAAAFGLYVALLPTPNELQAFETAFEQAYRRLMVARPTAVNLRFALDRMKDCFIANKAFDVLTIKAQLLKCAKAIKDEDILQCKAIAENGIQLLKKDAHILTHCNAGHLAVSRYGTALSPIYLAQQKGWSPSVFVDETRPLLQGARLTAFELTKGGVDATLICDNMVSSVMSQGKVDLVMVGCDRVASNGDVANKIGTSGVAILAKHYNIPFYVLGPTSSIDTRIETGKDIVIEERPAYEVTDLYFEHPSAPKGMKVYNPSFDVTPNELITAIITEKKIYYPPYNFREE